MHDLAGRAGLQEATTATTVTSGSSSSGRGSDPACGEHEERARVVLLHAGGFGFPVARAVLQDAKGVDPEVADVQGASQADSVAEGGGEVGDAVVVGESGVGECFGEGGRRGAPAVAEGDVGQGFGGSYPGVDEAHGVVGDAEVEDAGGESSGVGGGGEALGMAFGADFEPGADDGDVGGKVCITRDDLAAFVFGPRGLGCCGRRLE